MTNSTKEQRSFGGKAMLGMVAAGLACLASPSKSAAQTAEQNKAIVAESFADWKAGNGSPFDLLAENASWTIDTRALMDRFPELLARDMELTFASKSSSAR